MRRSNVPKFGDWENEGNVPYTIYFEKARQTRGNEKITLNDPHAQSNNSARAHKAVIPREQEKKTEPRVARPDKPALEPPSTHNQHQARARSTNRPELEVQRNRDTSRSNHEDGGQRRANAEAVGHNRAKRRATVGSDNGVEGSGLHRNQPGRAGAGAGAGGDRGSSHASTGRNGYQGSTANGFAPSTPGRSRAKPVNYTSDDVDYGSVVPKFGEWNEGNPGENYTEKFNNVLKERHVGVVVTPSPAGPRKQFGHESPKKCGCFPWSK